MNLRIGRVGKVGTFVVALYGNRAVRCHGVGRKEVYVTVSTGSDNYGVSGKALDVAGYQVTGNDTAGTAVDDDEVEHLVAGILFYRTFLYLAVERCVCTQQQLLSRLTLGIESTRYLGTTERTVGQLAAVFAGERYALSHALVDDVVRHFGQTVYVGFAGTVVTTLDRIVEEAVYRVAVVLIVFSSIDTALCGDRVSAAGRILNTEVQHVESQLAQRSGSRTAGKTRTNDDDVETTFIGRVHQFLVCFIIGPLFSQGAFGYFRIYCSHNNFFSVK